MAKTTVKAGKVVKPIDLGDIVMVTVKVSNNKDFMVDNFIQYIGKLQGMHLTSRAILLTNALNLDSFRTMRDDQNNLQKHIQIYIDHSRSEESEIIDSIQLFDVIKVTNVNRYVKEELKKIKKEAK